MPNYEIQYFFPLVYRNDGVLVPADPEARGADMPLVSDLVNYVEKHHVRESGIFDMDGRRFEGEIYRPLDHRDRWYVIVDSNGWPVGVNPNIKLTEENVSEISCSESLIEYSEALSPHEVISIEDSFIEPEFEELHADGSLVSSMSWNSLLEYPRLVVIGAPGAGKTTALRRLAKTRMDLWRKDRTSLYPIYVQMRNLHDGVGVDRLVLSSLTEQDSDFSSFNSLTSFAHKVLLIFDGVDEVSHDVRGNTIDAIIRFSEINPSIGIVISTRETGYRWNFPKFRYARILPFSPQKIREWSYYRLGNESKADWNKFLSSLEQRNTLHELAGNPLFLSIATSMYRRNSTMPQNRASLLRNYIAAMAEQWDSVRGVVRQREQWAAPHRKIAVLCRTAYLTRVSCVDVFSNSDFLEWNKNFDVPASILGACERDTGLVREVALGRWSFVHRSFADFLAAQYIVEHTSNAERYLDELVNNGDWLDIWAYSCGISQDATDLICYILEDPNVKKTPRWDALIAAFEQDIVVSEEVADRSAAYFLDELLRMSINLFADQDVVTPAEKRWRISRTSEKFDMKILVNVIRSIGKLHNTKMGALLQLKLKTRRDNVVPLAAAILGAEDGARFYLNPEVGDTYLLTVTARDVLYN